MAEHEHGIDWLNQRGRKGENLPVATGCTQERVGCQNCWAARWASHPWLARLPQYKGLTKNGRWTGEVRFHPEVVHRPLRAQKPRCYFVTEMSDLFHEQITFQQIAFVMNTIALCPQHRFMVLTKRIRRGLEFWRWIEQCEPGDSPIADSIEFSGHMINYWQYFSASTQDELDKGLPYLLECPAATRGLSLEPLLEPLDLDLTGIDHVIVGGESGPGARRFHTWWLSEIQAQCTNAQVPLYVKQFGANPYIHRGPLKLKDRKGADPSEWIEQFRIREFPKGA